MKYENGMIKHEPDFFIMEHNELINEIIQLECELFKKMDGFHIINDKCNTKCLSHGERINLNADIHFVFKRFIRVMKQSCSNLTKEDLLFCCLMKMRLKKLVVCHIMGNVNIQTVNQRKYRIKKKMEEAKCIVLFEMVFDYE